MCKFQTATARNLILQQKTTPYFQHRRKGVDNFHILVRRPNDHRNFSNSLCFVLVICLSPGMKLLLLHFLLLIRTDYGSWLSWTFSFWIYANHFGPKMSRIVQRANFIGDSSNFPTELLLAPPKTYVTSSLCRHKPQLVYCLRRYSGEHTKPYYETEPFLCMLCNVSCCVSLKFDVNQRTVTNWEIWYPHTKIHSGGDKFLSLSGPKFMNAGNIEDQKILLWFAKILITHTTATLND